jgi:Flp pilus assembly protein TadD
MTPTYSRLSCLVRVFLCQSAVIRWPIIALCSSLLLVGCATRSGYLNHLQPELATPPSEQQADKNNKPMYLDLISQMQQQGAYYASLANIDAFRQRYGSPPELRRLQGDALRETGQTGAAHKLYSDLLHTDQAGASWHGLGLIAAAQKQNAQAEQALSKAVQIDPVNVDYLGDLGYQRLCAGQLSEAHEPLAKAAELAPTNVKAVSNLVLWMLLNNDYAQADAAMQRANLPPATRQQVHALALQLRLAQQAERTTAMASLAPQQERAAMPSTSSAPYRGGMSSAANAQTAQSSVQSSVATGDGAPETMLERFGPSSKSSEAHP